MSLQEHHKELRSRIHPVSRALPPMPSVPTRAAKPVPVDDRHHSEIARDEWIANRDKRVQAQAQVAKPATQKSKVASPKPTWQEREKAAQTKVKRVQGKAKQASTKTHSANEQLLKQTPAFKENQHPRDRFGRFIRKAGSVALGATKGLVKGVVKTVKVTAKVAKGTHKFAKRANKVAKRNADLQHRREKLEVRKQELALRGTRRTKSARKRK